MITLSQQSVSHIHLLGVVGTILLVIYLFSLIKAITSNCRNYVKYAVPFSLVSILAFFTLDYYSVSLEYDKVTLLSQLIGDIPLALIIVIFVILSLCAFPLWLQIQKSISVSLSTRSIQEGLDTLPDGICFSRENGLPLLVNSKMQKISNIAFGTGVINTALLKERFDNNALEQGCSVLKSGEVTYLMLSDNTIWNVVEHKLTVASKPVVEYVAYDVTEYYNKSLELEKRNAHLSAVNKQLKEYNEKMDSIIREREILTAKISLHDNIGRSLLALRSYLSRENADRKELIELWRFTVSVLNREETLEENDNRLDTLIDAAKAVGVKITFDGVMPQEESLQEIYFQAVHECLTNTVKHAKGNAMLVKTRRKDNEIVITVTNNGIKPKNEILERGGLKNLRTRVEMNLGQMTVKAQPQFELEIRLRSEKI